MDLRKVKRLIYGLLIAAFTCAACAVMLEVEWLLYGFSVLIIAFLYAYYFYGGALFAESI